MEPEPQDWEKTVAILVAADWNEERARDWVAQRVMRWWKRVTRSRGVLPGDDEVFDVTCYRDVQCDAFDIWIREFGQRRTARQARRCVEAARLPKFLHETRSQEATQEGLEQLYRKLACFDPSRGEFNAFTYRVAERAIKNYVDRECIARGGDRFVSPESDLERPSLANEDDE